MEWCCFIRLWVIFHLILPCTSLTFDIKRQTKDEIPNDFEIRNGVWTKIPCRNSCMNSQFNTDNSGSGYCSCVCKYAHSTFRMGATPQQSSCIKNEDIRKDSDCKIDFESFSSSNAVPVLTNSGQGLKIKSYWPYTCKISGKPQYWDKGKWVNIRDDLFEIATYNGQYLKWKNNVISYHGRLMRQYIDKCVGQRRSCLVFKAEGTLKYAITVPTTAITTTTTTTTAATDSTSVSLSSSTSSTIPLSTDSGTSTTTNSTISPIVTDKPVTEDKLSTFPEDKPSTEHPGGNKGGHGDGSTNDNTLTIAAIAAVTTIVCVIIICLFIWFVMKKMRRREDKAYSSDMTVITNATGTNNTMSDGSVYCEPTEQHSHFPKQHSKVGNPVYAKALIHSSRPNNTNNLPKATNSYNNHYDNHAIVDSGEYAYPTYQDINPVKQVNSDYSYVEPEKPIYEELPANNIRESTYQPLVRDSQIIQDKDDEVPEYLALVNDDPSNHGNKQTIPEYLTIIPDKDSQSQAQSPSREYDYAIPEDQRVNGENGAKTSAQGRVYEVLENPNGYLSPVDGNAASKR